MSEFEDLQRMDKRNADADAQAEHDGQIANELLDEFSEESNELAHQVIYRALDIGRREGQSLGRSEAKDLLQGGIATPTEATRDMLEAAAAYCKNNPMQDFAGIYKAMMDARPVRFKETLG